MKGDGILERLRAALRAWFDRRRPAPRERRRPRAAASLRAVRGGRRRGRAKQKRVPTVPDKWRVFGESVTGVNHQRAGKPGQDAHCWTIDGSGRLVAAVADGAGSAPLGGEGAERASRVAVEAVLAMLEGGGRRPREILRQAVAAARTALEEDAVKRRCQLRDLATTLIVMIATRQIVAVAQIGDGFLLALNPDEEMVGHTLPQGGEYANETVFLTEPDALQRAEVSLWKGPISDIAISSDGLERIALQFPQRVPYRPFFDEIFRYCAAHPETAGKQLSRLINSDRVAARTADDVTLLVAWNQVVSIDGTQRRP